jgi:hypothetical protein
MKKLSRSQQIFFRFMESTIHVYLYTLELLPCWWRLISTHATIADQDKPAVIAYVQNCSLYRVEDV